MAVFQKIAVGFFGLPRNLYLTANSMKASIIWPAEQCGECVVLGHLNHVDRITDVRSGEKNTVIPTRLDLIDWDTVVREDEADTFRLLPFSEVLSHGDAFKNSGSSIKNLLFQLYSLKEVGKMALNAGADIAIFARSDLHYLDDLSNEIRAASRSNRPRVIVPNWQCYGGANDRFAICVGRKAIESYSHRFDRVLEYCQKTGRPLHSETFLRWVLEEHGLPVRFTGLRALRSRADGRLKREDFSRSFEAKRFKQIRKISNKIGRRFSRALGSIRSSKV